MWRSADIKSWSSSADSEPRYSKRLVGFVVGAALIGLITVVGIAFGFTHCLDNFVGTSILTFSVVSYLLMAIIYYLFARRLRAIGWFAPLWFVSYLPAAVLTMLEMRPLRRMPKSASVSRKIRSASRARS